MVPLFEFASWLRGKGIAFSDDMTVPELRKIVKDNRPKARYWAVVEARKHGHEVVFTPPYHPFFQEIEEIWAGVKNPIANHPVACMSNLINAVKTNLGNIKEDAWLASHRHVVKQEDMFAEAMNSGAEGTYDSDDDAVSEEPEQMEPGSDEEEEGEEETHGLSESDDEGDDDDQGDNVEDTSTPSRSRRDSVIGAEC